MPWASDGDAVQRRRTWADGWVERLPAPGPIGCKAPGHPLAPLHPARGALARPRGGLRAPAPRRPRAQVAGAVSSALYRPTPAGAPAGPLRLTGATSVR